MNNYKLKDTSQKKIIYSKYFNNYIDNKLNN